MQFKYSLKLTRRIGGLVEAGGCPNGPPRYPAPRSSLLDGYIESVNITLFRFREPQPF